MRNSIRRPDERGSSSLRGKKPGGNFGRRSRPGRPGREGATPPEAETPPQATEPDVIYGRWPVREALAAGPIAKIFLARGVTGGPIDEIVALAKQKKVAYHFVERDQISRIAGGGVVHQGVVALASPVGFVTLETVLEVASKSTSTGARLLFLDSITDPHNLGSLLRSAAFFGVAGVVIPKWRAAGLTPSVVRASAGAARLIPVAQVSNLGSAIDQAKKEGFWMVGADMDGIDARKADLPRPLGLVMGSEGEGLHTLIKSKCDVVAAIPRAPGARGIDSLNVGVAGGILLALLS